MSNFTQHFIQALPEINEFLKFAYSIRDNFYSEENQQYKEYTIDNYELIISIVSPYFTYYIPTVIFSFSNKIKNDFFMFSICVNDIPTLDLLKKVKIERIKYKLISD